MERMDFKRASYTFFVDLSEGVFVVNKDGGTGDISVSCSSVEESNPLLFYSDRPVGKVVSKEKREISLPCEIKHINALVYQPNRSPSPEGALATLLDNCLTISCFNTKAYEEALSVLNQAKVNDTLQLKISLVDCWQTNNGMYVLFSGESYACEVEVRLVRSISEEKNLNTSLLNKLDRFEEQLRYLGSIVYNYITYGKDGELERQLKDTTLEDIKDEIGEVRQAVAELNNTVVEISNVADRQLSIINNTYRTNQLLVLILVVLIYIGYRLS